MHFFLKVQNREKKVFQLNCVLVNDNQLKNKFLFSAGHLVNCRLVTKTDVANVANVSFSVCTRTVAANVSSGERKTKK